MARVKSAGILDDELDRATVHANGLVVDVIARDDGTVYVEFYVADGRLGQAIVGTAVIDRYQTSHPHLTLGVGRHTIRPGVSRPLGMRDVVR